MTFGKIIDTSGQRHLFAGLVVSVLGIAMICAVGVAPSFGPVHPGYAGAALVLIGVLVWLYGAVLRQGEMLSQRD